MSHKAVLVVLLGCAAASLAVPVAPEAEERSFKPSFSVNPFFGYNKYKVVRYNPALLPPPPVVPGPSYGAQAPSYSAPAAPSPSYGAPAAPAASYSAPAAPSYSAAAAPSQAYAAPAAPAQSYGAPAAPSPSYGASSPSYGAPATPVASYGAPAPSAYGAPSMPTMNIPSMGGYDAPTYGAAVVAPQAPMMPAAPGYQSDYMPDMGY